MPRYGYQEYLPMPIPQLSEKWIGLHNKTWSFQANLVLLNWINFLARFNDKINIQNVSAMLVAYLFFFLFCGCMTSPFNNLVGRHHLFLFGGIMSLWNLIASRKAWPKLAEVTIGKYFSRKVWLCTIMRLKNFESYGNRSVAHSSKNVFKFKSNEPIFRKASLIAFFGLQEYCSIFHVPQFVSPSQTWHINFYQ